MIPGYAIKFYIFHNFQINLVDNRISCVAYKRSYDNMSSIEKI